MADDRTDPADLISLNNSLAVIAGGKPVPLTFADLIPGDGGTYSTKIAGATVPLNVTREAAALLKSMDAETVAYCARKFAADATLRRRYGANTADPTAATYKAGLAKFFAVEKKCRQDEARPKGVSRDIEDANHDAGAAIRRVTRSN